MARRTLRLPITLGVVMIVLLVALTIGWVSLAVVGLLEDTKRTPLYVTLLSAGTTSLVLLLMGTVMYLALSVKAINLNRRQSNFIDSVTHELKSPIASIKLYLQTLSRRPVEKEERDEFYKFMLDDVDRLDDLINHLLDAARMDREPELSGEKASERIDLAEVLQECAHSVCKRHRVPPETITLDLQPCSVVAYRIELDMIYRNLLDNAIKYSGEPPEVSVSMAVSGDKARIRVQDNGLGIPKAERGRIFARFVRLGSELERKRPGTGLGLFIVRTLVKRLKGTIEIVDSSPSATGTLFQVQLPGAKSVVGSKPSQGQQKAASL
jgi:signal transduction histidine kinase